MPSSDLSRAIAAIRPVAILGPVFIHTRLHATPTPVEHLFATVLGDCAVPFLFFLSWLLFFGAESWERRLPACGVAGKMPALPGIWLGKLRRRVRSLLVPYLAWNLLAYLLGAFVLGTIAKSDFLPSFWSVRVAGRAGFAPADGPTYFLKTLMELALIAPAFPLVNRHAATAWVSPALALLWCVSPVALRGHTERAIVVGLVFFNLGAWTALRPVTRAALRRLAALAGTDSPLPLRGIPPHGGGHGEESAFRGIPTHGGGHGEEGALRGIPPHGGGHGEEGAPLREGGGAKRRGESFAHLLPAVLALAAFAALAAVQCAHPGSLPLHRATILASFPAAIALGGLLARTGLPLPGAASRAMFLFGAFDLLLPPLRAALVPRLGTGPGAYLALAATAVAVSALCHEALWRLCPAALRPFTGGR